MVAETTPKPNKQEILDHLTHLTRRWGELDEPCLLEVVHLSAEDKAQVKQVTHYKTDAFSLDLAADDIVAFNALKINCYATVNPVSETNRPKAGRRASADNIAASFFHFADADSAEAANNIRNFVGPKCTFQVITGTQPCVRPHVYWELEDPTRNLEAWSRTQAAIADTLKTDRVIDAPRIMRIGGTVNWPKPQKVGKGYVPEITQFKVYEDRPAVTSENMARAFTRADNKASSAQGNGPHIDTGPQPLDRERERIKALSGQEWNNAVFRLVGSYVRAGLSDQEITDLILPLTTAGYTHDDTREEVADMLRRTRENPKFEDDDEQTKERFEEEAKAAEDAEWPTEFSDFNELSIPRRQWIYGNHYLRGFVSVLASAGGIGKTSLQIVEALAIASGRPLLGEEVKERCNVWLVNLEDPMDEMKRRIVAAMKHYNVKPEEIAGRLFVDAGRDFKLTFAAQTKAGITLNAALVDYMKEKIPQRKIGVTFVDPFVGAHEVNENDNMAINAVISQVREIADETNSGFGLVHHIRKGNGEDANIDSVRGAGSLIGAARAARVINRISEKDAASVGIPLEMARGIFRVDDGKANLAPPAQKAVYRRMQGVQIANGEFVGVATPFELPDEWAGMSEGVVNEILAQIDAGIGTGEEKEFYSSRPQDKARWAGNLITGYPFDNDDHKKAPGQAKAILAKWLETGLLEEIDYHSAAQRKQKKGVISTGRVGGVS